MTLRYAHLAPAHKRKSVNMLDSLLNQSTNCTITAQDTKKELADFANSSNFMVGATGIEPVTPHPDDTPPPKKTDNKSKR